jgi:hypothetical protein
MLRKAAAKRSDFEMVSVQVVNESGLVDRVTQQHGSGHPNHLRCPATGFVVWAPINGQLPLASGWRLLDDHFDHQCRRQTGRLHSDY